MIYLCCSCGSVKHGWEKKWVVLDDQVLQLYDKENMGGESTFLSLTWNGLLVENNYRVDLPSRRR